MRALLISVALLFSTSTMAACPSLLDRSMTTLDERKLLRWANIADKLRIKGMGREYAGLLCEVGVDTVKELRYRNPSRLAKSMAEANKKRKLVRFLPSEKLVTRWVEHARKLPQKITY